MMFDFGLIIVLIFLNGVFAMSEMAIVSARKVRLQQLGENGNRGASKALELAEHPTRFLSTIQVGITSIGILSGALGEDAIARPLLPYLQSIPSFAPYAEKLALAITVVTITYLSLIVGELVPKRLALNFPERIAALIARPMHALSLAALPAVKILSYTVELALWLLRIKPKIEPSVTEEEIRLLLAQGTEEGVFEESEYRFMENILKLDDRKLGSIMTPRKDIVWIDVRKSFEESRQLIVDHAHWILPLCDGSLEQIVGFIKTKDILDRVLFGDHPKLENISVKALFVPDSLTLMGLLEQFRKSSRQTALVVDEYGEINGLVALSDVFEAIVGVLAAEGKKDRPEIIQRDDGSWLVDGMLDIDQLMEQFELDELWEKRDGHFYTVGGFIMLHLGHVPKVTDHFEFLGLRFEVVDMDGNRVDKVLISRSPEICNDESTLLRSCSVFKKLS